MTLFPFRRKRRGAETLARLGLKDERRISSHRIEESLQLLAGSMGDSWNRVSREAAAGMALVALNKHVSLQEQLNDLGWELVLTFVTRHPDYSRLLSRRVLADIANRQALQQPGLAAPIH